jgi:hypothetical protein
MVGGRGVQEVAMVMSMLTTMPMPMPAVVVVVMAAVEKCRMMGTVRVFRQIFTLEGAIGSHACEASMRVTNVIPLGCSLLLPSDTVNSVQTLEVSERRSFFFSTTGQHVSFQLLEKFRMQRTVSGLFPL